MWQLLPSSKTSLYALGALLCALGAPALGADSGFSGGVTPSRFELVSAPGKVLRKSLKVYNLGDRPSQFNVRTVDWRYSDDGQISFLDELQDDSCREWVALERHKINVVPDPQRPRNFRFEISVPEDQPTQECRFAIMLEGDAATHEARFNGGNVAMPIAGRIAVIVYVGIGGVEPEISIGQLSVRNVNRKALPVVQVRNEGSAHGRLDADLIAYGEDGKRVPLSIATSPVMPGQTRYLALTPQLGYELSYPLTVKGKIYSDAKSIPVEQTLQSASPSFIASQ